ncbi:WhiB family transcriptional regulator [Promicromonospora sp. NPDC057138]|uniref:WhiB family transcriptional regulator n=1 Tax=Promicromonospora sp. NPDC057138 TaxID=3346031 RepID=UPI00362C91BE
MPREARTTIDRPHRAFPAPALRSGESWRVLAACVGADPEAFYADDGAVQELARGICGRCPVRTICLADALDAPRTGKHGIWGGTTAMERANLTAGERADARGRAQVALTALRMCETPTVA